MHDDRNLMSLKNYLRHIRALSIQDLLDITRKLALLLELLHSLNMTADRFDEEVVFVKLEIGIAGMVRNQKTHLAKKETARLC